jgi:protein-L-isoaspartate(D-aspartate) O-methyltransferase
MDDTKIKRQEMVKRQLIPRGIRDSATLDSFLRVPREHYCLPSYRSHAYDDGPLPIGEGQTISQPYIVALMTQAAELGPNSTVLEIGTGSGYQAAILSNIAHRIYTVERIPSLAETAREALKRDGFLNVEVKVDDGTLGWPEKGLFDAIIVTAAGPDIPKSLLEQLKVGGRLIIPIGDAWSQRLVRVRKLSATETREEHLENVRFVPLIGEQGW